MIIMITTNNNNTEHTNRSLNVFATDLVYSTQRSSFLHTLSRLYYTVNQNKHNKITAGHYQKVVSIERVKQFGTELCRFITLCNRNK